MRFRLLVLAFAAPMAVLASGAPALAHWEDARWGMSPFQIVVATHAEIAPSDGPDPAYKDTLGARGTFAWDGHNGEATFHFRNNGLIRVRIAFNGRDTCFALFADLERRYGKPDVRIDEYAIDGGVWHRIANGDAVAFTVKAGPDRAVTCSLQYHAPGND